MNLSYLLEMTLVWLACYLFYYLWLRNERMPRANRFFLLFSLLAGPLIPLFPTINLFPAADLSETFMAQLEQVTVIGYGAAGEITGTEPGGVNWLFWTWIAGSLFSLFRLFGGWRQLYLLLHRAKKITELEDYRLVSIPSGGSPFSYANLLFWPEDMNPEAMQWQAVFAHERAHIRQGHTYDLLLVDILNVALWWNPLPYLYRRSLRLQHEYLADAAATENQRTNVRDYARLLLQHQLVGWVPRPGHAFYHSHLKNRIIMLTQPKGASWKLLAILPLFIMLLWACNEESGDITGTNMAETEAAMARENAKAEGLGEFDLIDGQKIYKSVDQMPIYGDCSAELATGDLEEAVNCGNTKLLTDIYTNIKYPAAAREAGAEGLVIMTFVVPASGGEIRNIEIVRGTAENNYRKALRAEGKDLTVVGYSKEDIPLQTATEKEAYESLDAAALNTAMNLPQSWTAGMHDGKPVAVRFNLPIKFQLE